MPVLKNEAYHFKRVGLEAGPLYVVALTYRVTVDVPARFRNSNAVGAVFGLTPSKRAQILS